MIRVRPPSADRITPWLRAALYGQGQPGNPGVGGFNETELTVLAFPPNQSPHVPEMTLSQFVTQGDQTKRIGAYRIWVACDNAIAVGRQLFFENKFLTPYTYNVPSLNNPGQSLFTWTATILTTPSRNGHRTGRRLSYAADTLGRGPRGGYHVTRPRATNRTGDLAIHTSSRKVMARTSLVQTATQGPRLFYNFDKAVGPAVPNDRPEVLLVQYFLREIFKKTTTVGPLPGGEAVDGNVGPQTFSAVVHFQSAGRHARSRKRVLPADWGNQRGRPQPVAAP